MKTLLISFCTEYEAGWGQRPDGFMISDDKNAMLKHIANIHVMGSQEYFWRYGDIKEVYCEDTTFNLIMDRKNKEKNVAFFDDDELGKLNLLKIF